MDSPGTHFDVMPTLMDILGVEDFVDHHMGRSLLAFDSGGWFDDDREEIVLSAEELGDLGKEGREERPHRAREGPTGSTYRNVDCV